MKNLIVAFDCDGTILSNEQPYGEMTASEGLNMAVVNLMEFFAKKTKNCTVIVWSGGGKDYAQRIVDKYGLRKWVTSAHGKDEDIKPDLAFDDIHEFNLGEKNVIVRMK